MKRGVLTVMSALAVAGLSALPASAFVDSGDRSAQEATTHVVAPGESIQAAVDVAEPGDTIQLQAGTYRESVLVQTDDITIAGAGSGEGGTLLLPPDEFPDNLCGENPPAPEPPPHGAGICMFGEWDGPAGPTAHATRYLQGGRVTGVRVEGFAINIATVATDGIRVDHNVSVSGGHYGMTHVLSRNGVFEYNEVLDAAHAGIYVGAYNIPDSGSVLRRNTVERSALAISTYDSQGVTITRNRLVDNCVGFLAFADTLRVPGGDRLTVTRNHVEANNEDPHHHPDTHGCSAIPSIDWPETTGAGIVLAGTTDSEVSRNTVVGNASDRTLSGGIVVVSTRGYGGGDVGDEADLDISRNTVTGNGPADLVWDEVGTGIEFTRNACGTSEPADLC